jgi:hypothetical protein
MFPFVNMFNHLNLLNSNKLIDIQKARKKKRHKDKRSFKICTYKGKKISLFA